MSEQYITMAHGAGGRAYQELVEQIFRPAFDNAYLNQLGDSAVCPAIGANLAFTTDSFVITPRFFPGGDIGKLAVAGTINDLAMSGAKPYYLTCSLILEVGLPFSELKAIINSMAQAAKQANVKIVSGDTKVVAKGQADGIYINTAGIGFFEQKALDVKPKLGDVIILSGNLAEHGLAILAAREGLDFDPPLSSDVAPLAEPIAALCQEIADLSCLRDPTRGGLASVLHEWAEAASLSIEIDENSIPMAKNTAMAAKILGIDPLYVANEGKFVTALPAAKAEQALAILANFDLTKNAAIIGHVIEPLAGASLIMRTPYGGQRIIPKPEGELLPRIC